MGTVTTMGAHMVSSEEEAWESMLNMSCSRGHRLMSADYPKDAAMTDLSVLRFGWQLLLPVDKPWERPALTNTAPNLSLSVRGRTTGNFLHGA